ncbi:hypothetical protein BGZ95_007239 [Linnemannia exigua]|uniref:HCP-like protein n=1 Tax=Linnemannia exigua TaxID=604196 RepID=A0AAD4DL45_9FUNG|nr:hypothetical protein BGZ95_007239 [Linnemannia exigua]
MPQDDNTQELIQPIRSVNKSTPPTAILPATAEEIFYIDCHIDPTTRKQFVLWDDILQAFKDAEQVRDKARVVPFLKGSDFRILEPRRIAALPNIVLDVVVGGQIETDATPLPPRNTPLVAVPASPLEEGEEDKEGDDVATATVGRNPAYGLLEEAIENYTHIDRPPPTGRGPHTLGDTEVPSTKDGIPAPPKSGDGRTPPLRAPHTTITDVPSVKDLTQTIISASHGDKNDQVALGDMYQDGRGVQRDYQAAMDWYLKAAEQGDAIGQRKVGVLYDKALGVAQSYSTAMTWYLKAAEQGDAISQRKIGAHYDLGLGVKQDYSIALDWYLKAAEGGDADAQCNVGYFHEHGQGVPQDSSKALEGYLKASHQNLARAQFNIGVMYARGRHFPQNYIQAMEWYLKAANQGYAVAQVNIGVFYEQGFGVSQDYAQAADWYFRAAAQGHVVAQHNIGVLFERGRGLPQDYSKAMEWYQKAAEKGHPGSRERMVALKEQGILRRLFN